MHSISSAYEYAMLAELAEANMQADFFAAAPTELARELGLTLLRTDVYTAGSVEAPGFAMYNHVQAVGLTAPLTPADIDDILSLYSWRDLAFSFDLSPLAQPASLRAQLRARGFSVSSHSARFYRLTLRLHPPAKDSISRK